MGLNRSTIDRLLFFMLNASSTIFKSSEGNQLAQDHNKIHPLQIKDFLSQIYVRKELFHFLLEVCLTMSQSNFVSKVLTFSKKIACDRQTANQSEPVVLVRFRFTQNLQSLRYFTAPHRRSGLNQSKPNMNLYIAYFLVNVGAYD